METAVLVAAFGIAVLFGFLLLFWMVNAVHGKRLGVGRMAVTTVGMCWAVWQVYAFNPVASRDLAYFLAPIAFVSVLLILSRVVTEARSEPPSEGPDVKTPAKAMRQPGGLGYESEEDEQKKIAVGE